MSILTQIGVPKRIAVQPIYAILVSMMSEAIYVTVQADLKQKFIMVIFRT